LVTAARQSRAPKQSAKAEEAGQREVVADYDDATNKVNLPKGWTADTPAELSVLVHEMVHHLTEPRKAREREKLADEAQERWLRLFGHATLKLIRLRARR